MRPYWPLRLLLGVVLLLAAYGFVYEPATLAVREYHVHLDKFGGKLRIAVIADLHGGAFHIDEDKISQVVARTNAAKPDLILLAGDYLTEAGPTSWEMPIATVAARLKPLHAPLGVYAVLGNHDYRPSRQAIVRTFGAVGITVLNDRVARIGIHGRTLFVAGITDFNTGAHFVRGAMVGIPLGQRAICLTHSPDVFPELPDTCALTIAGHTHGGQVWLPLIGAPYANSRYGQRYLAGVVREGAKTLFVSTGIGTSMLPVRFGVPPEVSLLRLK